MFGTNNSGVNMKAEQIVFVVKGMTCYGCEQIIQKNMLSSKGVLKVKADYRNNKVEVKYFPDQIDRKRLIGIIEQSGYTVLSSPESKKIVLLKSVLVLAVMIMLYQLLSRLGVFTFIPEIQTGSSLLMIFLVGVMTSVHCVAMCGGISLATGAARPRAKVNADFNKDANTDTRTIVRSSAARRAVLYNGGRILSYTITGAAAGLLGQVISINNTGRNIVILIAGLFMLLMGLNILELTPWLRKIKIPLPKKIIAVQAKMSGNSPFWIGLFNGLMPCGPLQMMQLYALGTGNVLLGALSMMIFALGTTPLMFGVSYFAGLLSGKKTNVIKLVSSLLVILLGIQMIGRAIDIPMLIQARQANRQIEAADGAVATIEDGYQLVETRFLYGRYQPIVVQAGIPVRWVITAQEGDLNGCNYSILIDEFGISQDLDYGETVIEFLPEEEGTYRYTCWMNMISSNITVLSSELAE